MPYIAYFIPSDETRPGRIWLRDTWGEIGLQSVLSAGAVSRSESLGDVSGCMIRPACAAQYANARILKRARRSESPAVDMLLCESPHPIEAALARRFQREGERVILGDGNAWLIPGAHPGGRKPSREAYRHVDGALQVLDIPAPAFVIAAMNDAVEARIDARYVLKSSAAERKAAALYYINLNYRIEQPEADFLVLLNEDAIGRVLISAAAFSHWAGFNESLNARDSEWRASFGEE